MGHWTPMWQPASAPRVCHMGLKHCEKRENSKTRLVVSSIIEQWMQNGLSGEVPYSMLGRVWVGVQQIVQCQSNTLTSRNGILLLILGQNHLAHILSGKSGLLYLGLVVGQKISLYKQLSRRILMDECAAIQFLKSHKYNNGKEIILAWLWPPSWTDTLL
ncbi:hypothetical protein SELMODRAFT_431598 [Selaginella moellendorffii]|uniref:Uncharacterized protein n=1 Tax=Selaginella moellendorffii TaxID=88036 RepID=D8TD60_SELML|nr:hypothetical protein SELMODRAFT_431598 [Selaginella moellendorffii]